MAPSWLLGAAAGGGGGRRGQTEAAGAVANWALASAFLKVLGEFLESVADLFTE